MTLVVIKDPIRSPSYLKNLISTFYDDTFKKNVVFCKKISMTLKNK